jgi:hypothetical protein
MVEPDNITEILYVSIDFLDSFFGKTDHAHQGNL